MSTKIFITGSSVETNLHIANNIITNNDNLSIATTYTTDKNTLSTYYKYMCPDEINLSYKNNVLLYISTEEYISKCITLDSFYNDDIFVLDIKDFNNISESVFENKDILVIWVDSSHIKHDVKRKQDIKEAKYLVEKLNKYPYLYFLNESTDIVANTVCDYLNSDEITRKEILEENC